jgi:hypothetical protein
MYMRCLDLYQFCFENKLILHGPQRTKTYIFIMLILHEEPLQLTPSASLYLNPLSCIIVHLCSVLYYNTLSNPDDLTHQESTGAQWVNQTICPCSHRGQANFSACPVWMHTQSTSRNVTNSIEPT